jgi:hypothetical protein
MRFPLSAGICLIALYTIDAYFCGGIYFDAVHHMAVHLRRHF